MFLNLELTEEAEDRVRRSMYLAKTTDPHEVVRRALAVYLYLQTIQSSGGSILTKIDGETMSVPLNPPEED